MRPMLSGVTLRRKDRDVIGILEDIADESIGLTRFFHSGRTRRGDG